MTGLDFEELDKAVKEAMDKASTPAVSASTTKMVGPLAATPSITKPRSGLMNDVTPVDTAPTIYVDSSRSNQTQPTTDSVAIPAQRGVYMDMMPTQPKVEDGAVSAKVSRHGVTIAPTRDDIVPPDPIARNSAIASHENDQGEDVGFIDPIEPATGSQESTREEEWPDPIEFDGGKINGEDDDKADIEVTKSSDDESKTLADNEPTSEEDEPAEMPEEHPADSPTPMTSPFLTDAKVEKMPLGKTPPLGNTETAVVTEKVDDTKREDDVEPAPKEDSPESKVPGIEKTNEALDEAQPQVALPDELKSDLLEIESDATNQSSEALITSPKPAPSPRPARPIGVSPIVAPSLLSRPESVNSSSNTAQHDPIYSTAAYQHHQTTPIRKKPGWWVVVAILGLLVLGAGGGVLFYLISTGSL